MPDKTKSMFTEIITAEIDFKPSASKDIDQINSKLEEINSDLERYTNRADKFDYLASVACGILTGLIDSFYVGQFKITEAEIGLSHKKVNQFIEHVAKEYDLKGVHLKDWIGELEQKFPVAQDNVWKGEGIGVSAKNHHLADLAHHPTPVGLVSAIIVQFFRVGIFVNKEGEWHLIPVDEKLDVNVLVKTWTPAVLSGLLIWLTYLAEKPESEITDSKLPEALKKLIRILALSPLAVELLKVAENWFGHLVSDMGGSKQTAGGGMGIPGIFMSFLYEMGSLPGLKETGLLNYINDLYTKEKFNLRRELPYVDKIAKMTIPVALNEIFVRSFYFVRNFALQISRHHSLMDIQWERVVPIKNRTIDRMLTIASTTFMAADTTDALIRSTIESAGNGVILAGGFFSRINYIGVGRAVVSVGKEIADEKEEEQLIHERRLLTEARSELVVQKIRDYRQTMEKLLSEYMAEDLEKFMEGFSGIEQGIRENDSNRLIIGSVMIQKRFGKEVQFSSQQELDDLMESDVPLKL